MSGLRTPPPDALEHARDVATRVRHRRAPVRVGFIERTSPSDADPPLARVLRGGQGGEVRLKLLLSLLWFSSRPPHETAYPARGWASLLGLPEPETNGARRINSALSWLAKNDLVRVVGRPGLPATVYLKDERGSGGPYVAPHNTIEKLRESDLEVSRDNFYIGLPAEFWTKGWVAVLTGSAVAMLLILMEESQLKKSTVRLWHSPKQAAERFALSQDCRTSGLAELERYEIVSMKRSPISPGVFDFRRMRNVYDLHLETLTADPGKGRPLREATAEEFMKMAGETDEEQEINTSTTVEPD